jgi:hypothetical protein
MLVWFQKNDVIVNKPIEILYKVKENEVASTLKYLASDVEGRVGQ